MPVEANKASARGHYKSIDERPSSAAADGEERALRAAFPDLVHVVLEQIGEGDFVAERIRYFGTHLGPFLGVAPTGREVTFTGMDCVRFQDGNAVDRWVVADYLDLRRQLLGLPDPARTETLKRLAREYYVVADRDGPEACRPFIGPHSAYHSANHTGFDNGIVPIARAHLFYTAFPDFTHRIVEQVAEGDIVYQRVRYFATHRGLFMGVPATGRKVTFTAMEWVRFENAKAVERWGVGDEMSLRRQLMDEPENPYSQWVPS